MTYLKPVTTGRWGREAGSREQQHHEMLEAAAPTAAS
jgi:hypothetical protein